jgi:predicted nucleic acid-binding protein
MSLPALVYWDASAILSALVEDEHTERAQGWIEKEGIHFISTLAYAEVIAVLERLRRVDHVSSKLIDSAIEALEQGPWQRVNLEPEWTEMRSLSSQWSLRGADLWHLSMASALSKEIGDLVFLAFDKRLHLAAKGMGFRV